MTTTTAPKRYRIDCEDCGYHPPFCVCEPPPSEPAEYHLGDFTEEHRLRGDRTL